MTKSHEGTLMGVSRETLTLPTYTLCGITYKSVA